MHKKDCDDMKRVKFIYNPVSGNGILKTKIDNIIEVFQRRGYQIIPHKLLGKSDVKKAFEHFEPDEYYAVVAAGGDGTVHEVLNLLKKVDSNVPFGIIPSGTSNDFANYLGLPKDINECIDVITIKNKPEFVDIGQVNSRYFINVVAGGILSSIAHKAKKELKNYLGMFAYYIKALEEIPNIKPFHIEIDSDTQNISEDALMFLILNTSIAGGFKVAPNAVIDDGLLDVFVIKNCSIPDFAGLFLKLLRGEHVQDEKVIYFQASELKVNCDPGVEVDIDGEKGHEFPLEIKVLPNCMRVFK